ncbi:unnamed protein product [Paramecium pentaurelia]|uniref:Uncharacterized protein n=1 Tax=Paramecium pentaurelia TaxID=43138 RepID=A0A8S1U9G7_9CILI|nr:unnamed protein product [Paramecium pentaurelia]
MDFYIRQLHITIQQIKEKMQKLADHGGKYDLKSHNCQHVAWKILMYIIKYTTFFYAQKYSFKKDYQKFAALYFNKLIKDSTQIYSIIKLRELKQLIKQKKDVSTFKL